jgi:hypothetical protein
VPRGGGRLRVGRWSLLHAEAMRGYSLVPKRGAEIGGILLGAILPGPTETVLVKDFEAIPSDYTQGPVYVLNGRDRNRFRDRLLELATLSESTPKPVGYFRSHTGDGIQFKVEDTTLMHEFFPDDLHVALIIKPSAFSGSTAQVFVRENGAFETRSADAAAAFRARDHHAVRSEPRRNMKRELEPAAEPPVTEDDARDTTTREVRPQPPRSAARLLAWICLSIGLVVLGGSIARLVNTRQAGDTAVVAGDPYSAGIRIDRVGDALLLTWNRSAAAVQSASRATIAITDGGVTKTVALDSVQLRSGSVLYRHVAPEIHFRFEVHLTNDRSVIETALWRDRIDPQSTVTR